MDDQFNQQAQEAADEMNKAAERSWENLEAAANQAAQNVEDAAQNLGQPAAPQYTPPQAGPAGYTAPQAPNPNPWSTQAPHAQNDPNRWTGELYTPEVTPAPPSSGYNPQDGYIDAQRVGATPPPYAEQAKKDDGKFPVWAIILIVLLVLCICAACTILPFAALGRMIFQSM